MEFVFENIDNEHERAKVLGGWLVKANTSVYHLYNGVSEGGEGWDWRVAMTFVPDPDHEWSLCKDEDAGKTPEIFPDTNDALAKIKI